MRAVSILALGAAAFGALAISSAQAQVIQRSVSEEPVETTVTQTPDGTVITRRPLSADAPAYQAPVTTYQPAPMTIYRAPATPVVETDPDSVDTVTTRDVVRRMETRPVRLDTRTSRTTTRKTVRKITRVERDRPTRRVVTRTVREPVPVVALSPAERHIVYQTIVQREVVAPAPRVVAPAYRDSWRNEAWREDSWREPYNAPVMAADEDVDVTTAPLYTVGSVLPQNVPLFAVPQEVGYRVPATQRYSYAYLGGRAYLVDPNSGVIVADVTE